MSNVNTSRCTADKKTFLTGSKCSVCQSPGIPTTAITSPVVSRSDVEVCAKHNTRFLKGVGSCSKCSFAASQSALRSEARNARKSNQSPVRRMEKAQVTFMEPSISGQLWLEKTVEKYLWECLECGLVWQMKHEALSCKSRNHKSSYIKHYGGYYENGIHRGGREIRFDAVRRETVSKPATIDLAKQNDRTIRYIASKEDQAMDEALENRYEPKGPEPEDYIPSDDASDISISNSDVVIGGLM